MRKQVVFAILGIILAVAVACSRSEETTPTPTEEPATTFSVNRTPEPTPTVAPDATPRSTLTTPGPTATPRSTTATPGPTATPGSTSVTPTATPRSTTATPRSTTATPRPTTATVTPRPASTSAPIPLEFRRLYAELETRLDEFEAEIDSEWDGKPYENLSFLAELLTANGNSGSKLLEFNSIPGSILFLNRLQELGVQGVKLSLAYPLLSPDYPRSDEYIQFYRRIAQEVKRRGMTLFVNLAPSFIDPVLGSGEVDYTGLTFEAFKAGIRQHTEIAISEMQPDFLTVAMEPNTAASNTGLEELREPDNVTELVNFLLDGLDRQGTLIGAGTGTWEDQAFIEQLSSNTDLDYIDLHIYPLGTPFQDFLRLTIEYADIAKRNGKMVVLGEAWLYKAAEFELVSGGSDAAINPDIFRRDVFSFWEPLDQKFLEVISRLGNYKQFEFVSFFWSRYLFGYLDIAKTDTSLDTDALLGLANQAAVKNLIAGEISGTGQAYKDIIDSN